MINQNNNRLVLIVRLLCLCLFISYTPTTSAQSNQEMSRDLKWITQSVEYVALCTQVYNNAWQAVQRAAQNESRDWVVVLDVDETVLDNSQYAVERRAIGADYTPESWAKWVFRKEATLVPGAKKFIDRVRSLGELAHIAYITNRRFEHEQATFENLQKYDLFKPGDIILTRKGREDTKAKRRRCLETGTGRCQDSGPLVILALIGDNIRDIMPVRGLEQARALRQEKVPEDPNWGVKYFILPNPTYGSWVRDYR